MKKHMAICAAVLGLSYHAMASEKSAQSVNEKAAVSKGTTAERVELRTAADSQNSTVEQFRQATGIVNYPAGDGRPTFTEQKEAMFSVWGEREARYDERFGARFF